LDFNLTAIDSDILLEILDRGDFALSIFLMIDLFKARSSFPFSPVDSFYGLVSSLLSFSIGFLSTGLGLTLPLSDSLDSLFLAEFSAI
jgi:hypothetical protein